MRSDLYELHMIKISKSDRLNCDVITTQKNTIHHVTTMLATSENVLFLGHNHLLTTGADDPTLIMARAQARVIIKMRVISTVG